MGQTAMAKNSGTRGNPRPRVRRMVQLLEKYYGVPQWDGPSAPLDSMVKTILSQSTSDANSGAAFRSLKRRFPSWKAVAEADPAEIADAIRPGGLANQKGVRIRNFLLWAKEQFGAYTIRPICEMDPGHAYDLFCTVHGIGVKTVAVTLLFACGKDVFPVDTHVNRITRRVGVVPANSSPEKTHWLMAPHVPRGKGFSLHVNLLRLGREVCRSAPKCGICPLRRTCDHARSPHRSESAAGNRPCRSRDRRP
jgi:endonuclease-3